MCMMGGAPTPLAAPVARPLTEVEDIQDKIKRSDYRYAGEAGQTALKVAQEKEVREAAIAKLNSGARVPKTTLQVRGSRNVNGDTDSRNGLQVNYI